MADPSLSTGQSRGSVAKKPFDIRTADIIIRTSDNVDFYVYKAILAIASPFFDYMFSLAQTAATPTDNVTQDPVVVSEDSDTMDCLLRLCYPIDDPNIADLDQLDRVLEAAMKYQMGEATKLARHLLSAFIKDRPLQVYTVACRLKVEEEARMAAEAWTRMKPTEDATQFHTTLEGASYVPEMRRISSGAYFRLIEYARGASPANATFSEPPSLPPVDNHSHPNPKPYAPLDVDPKDADVILRSSDEVNFPVQKLVIQLATADRLLDGQQDGPTAPGGGIPIVKIGIESGVLAPLLKLCYNSPIACLDVQEIPVMCALVRVAMKYDLVKIISTLKEWMTLHACRKHPLSPYLVAVELGWTDEAREAAKHTFTLDLRGLYAPEMEYLPADAYHRLLEYNHTCRSIVLRILGKYAPNATQWKSSKWWNAESLLSDSTGDFVIALPIVEREICKAAGTRKHSSQHPFAIPYNASTSAYNLDMSALIEESRTMHKEIREALCRVSGDYSNSLGTETYMTMYQISYPGEDVGSPSP